MRRQRSAFGRHSWRSCSQTRRASTSPRGSRCDRLGFGVSCACFEPTKQAGGSFVQPREKGAAHASRVVPAQLLRLAFARLAELDFVRAGVVDGALFTLDQLTRVPLLQRALVRRRPPPPCLHMPGDGLHCGHCLSGDRVTVAGLSPSSRADGRSSRVRTALCLRATCGNWRLSACFSTLRRRVANKQASMLLREAEAAAAQTGSAFERASVLAPLLQGATPLVWLQSNGLHQYHETGQTGGTVLHILPACQ